MISKMMSLYFENITLFMENFENYKEGILTFYRKSIFFEIIAKMSSDDNYEIGILIGWKKNILYNYEEFPFFIFLFGTKVHLTWIRKKKSLRFYEGNFYEKPLADLNKSNLMMTEWFIDMNLLGLITRHTWGLLSQWKIK